MQLKMNGAAIKLSTDYTHEKMSNILKSEIVMRYFQNKFQFPLLRKPFLNPFIQLISLFLCLGISSDRQHTSTENRDLWVGAYLASWEHYAPPTGNWGRLPTEQIDWDAFTHLYYFSLNVNSDGTLSEIEPYQNVGPDRINSVVSAARLNNTPVLFSVGGWGNYEGFSKAITSEIRPDFIRNLISIMTHWGFNGIDLDMEPIRDEDVENYKRFVIELHEELQSIRTQTNTSPLLVAATAWQPEMFSELQHYFDQINLMTYDFSGAWNGWVSWHNSPVYSGGKTFPGSNKPLPSVDRMVTEFKNAGLEPSKIGIGIDFYGYVWQGGSGTETGGVTHPNQQWDTPPSVTDNVPYHRIMDEYYQPEYFKWDEEAQAAYISIDRPGASEDLFISFEEERAIEKKIRYAYENRLGGVFIWELSGGYQTKKPAGQRDLLLKVVKETFANAESLFQNIDFR